MLKLRSMTLDSDRNDNDDDDRTKMKFLGGRLKKYLSKWHIFFFCPVLGGHLQSWSLLVIGYEYPPPRSTTKDQNILLFFFLSEPHRKREILSDFGLLYLNSY